MASARSNPDLSMAIHTAARWLVDARQPQQHVIPTLCVRFGLSPLDCIAAIRHLMCACSRRDCDPRSGASSADLRNFLLAAAAAWKDVQRNPTDDPFDEAIDKASTEAAAAIAAGQKQSADEAVIAPKTTFTPRARRVTRRTRNRTEPGTENRAKKNAVAPRSQGPVS